METLVCDTPGLELAYAKFTEVNSDERIRELAWVRERAIRNEHDRLLFEKMEGRAAWKLFLGVTSTVGILCGI